MLSIVTIALDAMPFITWHLPKFEALSIPWHWYVVEGAAMNNADTSWCRPQEPRLSGDGTAEYLRSIDRHPNVTVIQRERWEHKTGQMNAGTSLVTKPGVLMQVDADEIHETVSLERIHALFAIEPGLAMMLLPCLYFVGPDLVTDGENCYGAKPDEWRRAFRFTPGQLWERHEPPVLSGAKGRTMSRAECRQHGLTFHHFAYATEAQVRFKERFYGYAGAVEQWRKLQAHRHFPDRLQKFFPWTDDRVMVRRL